MPDLIVSDIAMPGDDAYALIRKIRARKVEEGGRMLAVALTAYGRSEDRMKALSAGFHVHVGKPIDPSHLVSVVASVTGHASGTRHGPAPRSRYGAEVGYRAPMAFGIAFPSYVDA